MLRWSHLTPTSQRCNWWHETWGLGWIDCNTRGCICAGGWWGLIKETSLFGCRSRNFHQQQIAWKKKKIQPKTWLWKRVISNRKAHMVFDPTRCAVTLSQPYETKALRCLACCLPAPSSEAAPSRLHGEELCPQVLYQILPFSVFRKRFFSLFHAPPQMSLTVHILDRKRMVTRSEIEHCGIKIN